MKQAMIFAAGLGTRLRPLTDHRPKALVEVAGLPLLEHQLRKLRRAGFTRVVVNVHHFGEQIIDYMNAREKDGLELLISDERGALLDTGGGLSHALPLFAEAPVLVHNVDIVSDLDLEALWHAHLSAARPPLATLAVNERSTSRYLLTDGQQSLRGWMNIKSGEVKSPIPGFDATRAVRRAFLGVHVVDPQMFPLLRPHDGAFSIIDFYLSVAGSHEIRLWDAPKDLRWVDAGKPETLASAAEILSVYN